MRSLLASSLLAVVGCASSFQPPVELGAAPITYELWDGPNPAVTIGDYQLVGSPSFKLVRGGQGILEGSEFFKTFSDLPRQHAQLFVASSTIATTQLEFQPSQWARGHLRFPNGEELTIRDGDVGVIVYGSGSKTVAAGTLCMMNAGRFWIRPDTAPDLEVQVVAAHALIFRESCKYVGPRTGPPYSPPPPFRFKSPSRRP